MKAKRAIISEISDNNPIPTRKESRKSKNGQIPNRGKLPVTRKIMIPQNEPTISMLIRVLK